MTKVALCIGIAKYNFVSELTNPINDARDINSKLKDLGYEVSLIEEPTRVELLRAIDDFRIKTENADVTLIYYAGHGIQSNGENYLLPIDSNPKSETELRYFCIPISDIIIQDDYDESKTNIFIFDACRNNPFENTWGRSTSLLGFAPILAPSGTLIAFSTSPGQVASDGSRRNGLYTEALLDEIKKPDLSIIQVFQNVRQRVLVFSNNTQLPWESTSLLGDFYFNPKSFNPSDTVILLIKKNIIDIDSNIFKYKKEERNIEDESTEGGIIIKYFLDGVLIKVEKQLLFEGGSVFYDIYFSENNLIYYKYSEHHYNVPVYVDDTYEYTESFDEEKTKTTINEYFINHDILIGVNKIKDNNNETIDEDLNIEIMKQIEKILNY